MTSVPVYFCTVTANAKIKRLIRHNATNAIKVLAMNQDWSVLRLHAPSFYFFEDEDKRKNGCDSCRFHWILIITRADFSSSLNVTSDLGQSLVFRWLINSSFCLLACLK